MGTLVVWSAYPCEDIDCSGPLLQALRKERFRLILSEAVPILRTPMTSVEASTSPQLPSGSVRSATTTKDAEDAAETVLTPPPTFPTLDVESLGRNGTFSPLTPNSRQPVHSPHTRPPSRWSSTISPSPDRKSVV